MPLTIRYAICFESKYLELVNGKKFKKQLPYLKEIDIDVPIRIAKQLNFYSIKPEVRKLVEMPVYNPRKLTLARENYFEVVEHPELFKKLSQIVLDSPSFNFDIVPENIKRADFGYFVKFVMDEEYRGKVDRICEQIWGK